MGSCLLLTMLVAISFCTMPSQPARILGLSHFNGRSMFFIFESLMKELAARGHDVTVVSHFPQNTVIENYTDISIEGSLPVLVNNLSHDTFNDLRSLMDYTFVHGVERCRRVLEHRRVQELIKSPKKYDLVIIVVFSTDCLLSFSHILNTPVVYVVTNAVYPWMNNRFGNPDIPSYIPNYYLPFTSDMNFVQRVRNYLLLLETKWRAYYETEYAVDELARKHFGESLPLFWLWELRKKSSLLLVNSHFSIHQPRPTVPAFVEVGGMHIRRPRPLPEDIEKFLNDSKHGIVYLSFGSLMRLESFPNHKLRALLDAFAELPHRVLMKSGSLSGVPKNVKTVQWLPQLDVLCHPNVLVFMSHGGLLGTEEAIYCGVPIIGTSFYADQHQNINNYVKQGFAARLDYDVITKDTVSEALRAVLGNSSYRQNAKRKSFEFRDRPKSPLETAIYWTEYVIRNDGAPYIRSEAVDLTWYHYHLLDAVITTIGFIVVFCCTLLHIITLVSSLFVRKVEKCVF